MKRVIFSVVGTVAGLVSLLSFKTHGHPLTVAGGLPAASLPSSNGATTSPATSSAATPKSGSGSAAAHSSTSAANTATRTVSGQSVDTQYGIVQVQVTASGKKITNVQFLQLTAFDQRSQEINSYAAPILLQETLQAQTAQVDAVSGATYTSDGYMQSVQSALDVLGI